MARNGLVEPFWRVGLRAILIGYIGYTLGGIGIAPSVFRTVVRVSRETYPPYYPTLLDNNIWLDNG